MQKRLRITVDGQVYDVTVDDLTDDSGSQLYPAPGSMSTSMAAAPPGSAAAAESAQPAHLSSTTAAAPAVAPDAAGSGAVISPMTGVLASVLVSVGQQVSSGDTVAVIEAMKMKTPLVTELSGTVAAISVAEGGAVEAGQTVLTLE